MTRRWVDRVARVLKRRHQDALDAREQAGRARMAQALGAW